MRAISKILGLFGLVVCLCGCRKSSTPPVRFPQFAERSVAGPGNYLLPRWSLDGRYLAYLSFDNARTNLMVYELQSEKHWTVAVGIVRSYDWSPDGRLTYLKYRPELSGTPFPEVRDLHLVDVDGRNDQTIATNLFSGWDFAWFPDGQSMAILLSRPTGRESCQDVYTLNSHTGEAALLVSSQELGVGCVERIALSHDGSQLLAYGLRGSHISTAALVLYDLKQRAKVEEIIPAQTIPSSSEALPAFLGDDLNIGWIAGDRWILAKATVASGECYNYSLFFFNTSNIATNFCVPTQEGPFAEPTISPDLSKIAYVTTVGPSAEYLVIGEMPSELQARLTLAK
jgi:WD40 repeat protein